VEKLLRVLSRRICIRQTEYASRMIRSAFPQPAFDGVMKSKFFSALLTGLFLPALLACSTPQTGEPKLAQEETTQPDPSDEDLRASIAAYLKERGGPQNSQYEYTRVDLNKDGRREGIVLFTLPHSYWCGWGGCTMAVFQPDNETFSLVSETSRIRGPIVVSPTETNGWDDIAVRLSGTNVSDYNVLLRYNGASYPPNPLDQAVLPYDLASLGGTRLFP
jgi:hypothetical protein